MTHGFPSNPNPVFTSTRVFPVENRPAFGSVDAGSLKTHLDSGDLLNMLSDFHFLVFLHDSHLIEKEDLGLLLKVVKDRSSAELAQLVSRPSWQTFLTILSAASGPAASQAGHSGSSSAPPRSTTWACRHCTFVNTGSDCDMCGLPRD